MNKPAANRIQRVSCVLGLLALNLASNGHAHHGNAGQFNMDESLRFEVSGVITEIAMINPHAYVYFDVGSPDGEITNWRCELRGGGLLRSNGWREEHFAPGTQITLYGSPAHAEETTCYTHWLFLNGGPVIQRGDSFDLASVPSVATRPERLANGDPNIAGSWVPLSPRTTYFSNPETSAPNAGMGGGMGAPGAMGGMGAMGGDQAGGPPSTGGMGAPRILLTDEGAAVQQAIPVDEQRISGRLDCRPRDFFNDWLFDRHPNLVTQTETMITMTYGFMDTHRVIHLDQATHPAEIEPSWVGHSIGYWEDEILYVDTVGFGRYDSRSSLHSDQLQVTEQFELGRDGDRLTLIRRFEGEDPLFWQHPVVGEQTVHRSDYSYEPYNCDDRAVEPEQL